MSRAPRPRAESRRKQRFGHQRATADDRVRAFLGARRTRSTATARRAGTTRSAARDAHEAKHQCIGRRSGSPFRKVQTKPSTDPVAELQLAHQQRRHQRAMAHEVDGVVTNAKERPDGPAEAGSTRFSRRSLSPAKSPHSRNVAVTPVYPVGAPARRGKVVDGNFDELVSRRATEFGGKTRLARSGRFTNFAAKHLNAQSTSRNATPNVTRSWFHAHAFHAKPRILAVLVAVTTGGGRCGEQSRIDENRTADRIRIEDQGCFGAGRWSRRRHIRGSRDAAATDARIDASDLRTRPAASRLPSSTTRMSISSNIGRRPRSFASRRARRWLPRCMPAAQWTTRAA